MLCSLVVVIFVLLVILDRWKPEKFKKMHAQLGCDFFYVPIFGHCYLLLGGEGRVKNYFKIARQCYKNTHGMISFWFLNRIFVAITDPLQAKLVLKTCLSKGLVGRFAVDVLGNSLAFTTPDEWRPRRKVTSAVLAPRFVKDFVEIFSRQSEDLCNNLASKSFQGDFSLWEFLYGYSLDVICEAATGINMNLKNHLNHPVSQAVEESMRNVMRRISQPWQQVDALYKLTASYRRRNECKKILEDFTSKLISKKKSIIERDRSNTLQNEKPNLNKKTILELMMEFSRHENSSDGYDDEKLLEEILVLVIGGTDTTTMTAGFVCMLLSMYPDVQDKAYKEIKEVVGETKKPLMIEDLEKLVYVEAVIKEVSRLYPAGSIILRECEKENVVLPCGVTFYKGTTFLINIIGINRNPRYWGEDAEEFRPERFIEGEPSHPSAFMTFSYGQRNCIGQGFAMTTLKMLIVNILRRYRITPATCYKNAKQVRVSADVMLRPVHSFQVQIQTRS